MQEVINQMISTIRNINPNLAISFVDGLLSVGAGASICVTDNPLEQRSVLAGVLLGLTAPAANNGGWDDDQDDEDDEDNDPAYNEDREEDPAYVALATEMDAAGHNDNDLIDE